MAEIKDGIYAYVSGTVGKVFNTKNGAAIEVHVKGERSQYADKVTVWGLGDQVAEGDRVVVKGWWSDKRETYQKQDGTEGVAFRRALNSPKLEQHERGGGQGGGSQSEWASAPPAARNAPQGGFGAGFDDEQPF